MAKPWGYMKLFMEMEQGDRVESSRSCMNSNIVIEAVSLGHEDCFEFEAIVSSCMKLLELNRFYKSKTSLS